jgi:hypothetical protein
MYVSETYGLRARCRALKELRRAAEEIGGLAMLASRRLRPPR